MLQLYRNNQIFTGFWVILYLLPFSLANWFTPYTFNTDGAGILVKSMLEYSKDFNYYIYQIIILLLAFWGNYFVNNHRLNKRSTYFTVITTILCFQAFKDTTFPTAALLVNIPLLLILQNLYAAYERKNSIVEIFNAGAWVAVAALCYSPAIWLVLLVVLSWLQLRAFNIQEFIILICGILMPFFLLGTYLYLNDQLLDWWQNSFIASFGLMELKISWTAINIIPLIWIFILLLWTLTNFSNLKNKTTVREQKYLNVLLLTLLVLIFSIVGLKMINLTHWGILILPFSIFLSLNLQSLKNPRMANLIHWILWTIVLLTQTYHFL